MKQAIVNFCKSTDTGLFLLDMPTGFGKTYSVLDFMVDNYDSPEFKDKMFWYAECGDDGNGTDESKAITAIRDYDWHRAYDWHR